MHSLPEGNEYALRYQMSSKLLKTEEGNGLMWILEECSPMKVSEAIKAGVDLFECSYLFGQYQDEQ